MVSLLQLFVALFFVTLGASAPVEELVERTEPDWGNYVYISSISSGIVGQNFAVIATPGNRAACPTEVWNLQSCADSFESECMEERYAFEWCLQHRITTLTCGPEWLNMTLGCMGFDSAYCVETLTTLHTCAVEIVVPSVPPP